MHVLLSFSGEEMVLEYLTDRYCKHFIVRQHLVHCYAYPLVGLKLGPCSGLNFA